MKIKNYEISSIKVLKDLIKKVFIKDKKSIAFGEGNIMGRFIDEVNFKKIEFKNFLGSNKEIRNKIKKKKTILISANHIKKIDIFLGCVNFIKKNIFVKSNINFSNEKVLIEKSKKCIFLINNKKREKIFMSEFSSNSRKNTELFLRRNKISFFLNKKKNGNFVFNENNFIVFTIKFGSINDLIFKNSLLKSFAGYFNNSIFNFNKNFVFIKISDKKIFFFNKNK